MASRVFPLVPKTTTGIEPGDFWAIPLRRGGWFACGRVLWLGPGRVTLTVGLLDWCEPGEPTAASIADSPILTYGQVHLKCVLLTGGALLGHHPLDGDTGWTDLQQRPDFRRGMGEPIWGYLEIESRTHRCFGRHFPVLPERATERPVPLRRKEG